ncbi:MAG: hypothetical protein IPG07_07075 [Crocinitomicaceae bacterium]|nr:hypothetical protein [Crocinitomicaceae bacterium]
MSTERKIFQRTYYYHVSPPSTVSSNNPVAPTATPTFGLAGAKDNPEIKY